MGSMGIKVEVREAVAQATVDVAAGAWGALEQEWGGAGARAGGTGAGGGGGSGIGDGASGGKMAGRGGSGVEKGSGGVVGTRVGDPGGAGEGGRGVGGDGYGSGEGFGFGSRDYLMTKLENQINTDRDCVPGEVATAMLSDPKVRLTRHMRRVYQQARETVYPSARPIVRPMRLDNATGALEPLGYEYASEPREILTLIVRKAQEATCWQLQKWSKRLFAQRRVAQRRWERLNEAIQHQNDPKKRAALEKLADYYDRLVKLTIEPQLELFEEILAARQKSEDV